LIDFDEAPSPKDEAGDNYQGTPRSTQLGTQSSSEFSGLSPITPANRYGLPGGMTLLDLMATPPDRKPLIFEPPEFLDVPLVPNEKEVFNDIVEKEFKGAKDTVTMSDEMDSEPKEQAKKFEAKLLEDLLQPLPVDNLPEEVPKPKRTKRKAERSDVVSRKKLASTRGRGLPPVVPKSNTAKEQDEGKAEPLPGAAATKVYARKFSEKSDNILKQAEIATHACKCAPITFFAANQQLVLIRFSLFIYTNCNPNTW